MAGAAADKNTPGAQRDLPPSMVERMTLILDVFEQPSTLLKFDQVAGSTGLPRSTVHRILDQLVRLHWLDHHSKHGYRLGRRALRLGGNESLHVEIRRAAAPHLHELHVRTGMVVHLAVLEGAEEVILDKLGGQSASESGSRVGGHNPAHLTTGGRALLAWLDPQCADALVQDTPCSQDTSNNPMPGVLHQELNRIRRSRGLSIDRAGAMNTGMNFTGVALAIRGPQGPVAAVSLYPGSRVVPLEHVAPLLVEAVRRTTADLFPHKTPQHRPLLREATGRAYRSADPRSA